MITIITRKSNIVKFDKLFPFIGIGPLHDIPSYIFLLIFKQNIRFTFMYFNAKALILDNHFKFTNIPIILISNLIEPMEGG